MSNFPEDTALIQALVAFSGGTAYSVAKRAGVAVSTVNRPFNGTAENRLGRSVLDKLKAAFPDFPGWDQGRVGDSRVAFRGFPVEPPSGTVEVAGIDLNFGLGPAFMDQEVIEHQAEKMHFPATWLRQITSSPADQLYWTRGVGNSMEPAISDGDVILIDRSKIGSSFGDLYWAIAYGQTGMIKRLRPMPDGSVKILSDNQSVPPEIAYDGELHVFGRVVAVIRRL